jgi:hypothetical protein
MNFKLLLLFMSLILFVFSSSLLAQENASIINDIMSEYQKNNDLITSAIVEYTIDQRFTPEGQKGYEYYVLDPNTATQPKKNWALGGMLPFHKEYTFKLDQNRKYEKVLNIPHADSIFKPSERYLSSNGIETISYNSGSKSASRVPYKQHGGEITGPINFINFGRIITKYGNVGTNNISPELTDIRFIDSAIIEGKEYYWVEGKVKYESNDFPILLRALLDPSKGYVAKRIEKIDTANKDGIPYSLTLDFLNYRLVPVGNGNNLWVADTIILKDSYAPTLSGKIASIVEQEIKLKDIQLNVPIQSSEMIIELPDGVEIY